MTTRTSGFYTRPGAVGKDDPIAASIYYRPFVYGTPSRMGMMGRGFGLGINGRRGWGVRWLKSIFGRHKNN